MSTVQDIFTGVEGRTKQSINASSDPSTSACIQFLNEDIAWILAICAEEKSELGRVTGSITTVDGTASYSDLSSMYAPYQFGWVVKTNSRDEIELTTEDELLDRSVTDTNQPDKFYVDGSNNVVFIDTPDDAYTIKIPYWPVQTALTVVGDTIPFNGLFDNLLIESVTIRIQNRDEYDLPFETRWRSFLTTQARRVIQIRKGLKVEVGL